MTTLRLSAPAKRAYIALMILGCPTTNPIIRGRFGFEIEKKHRDELKNADFIEVKDTKTPFVISLTEQGKKYADELCSTPVREYLPAKMRRDDSQTRLAIGILNCVDRYLRAKGLKPADVLIPAVGDLIHAVYDKLAKGSTDNVSLVLVRRELAFLGNSGVGREEIDAALVDLHERGEIVLSSEENLKALSKAAKEAGVPIGGDTKHLISIGRR
jgi:hypothetical protein